MQCAWEQTGWVLLHHRVTHSSMFPVSVCTHELWQAMERRHRVPTESWILEKVLTFAQQFSRPGKSLENGDKIWKNAFFQSYSKCFISAIFVVLVKSYSVSAVRLQRIMKKKALFLGFFKVYIDHLFDNLESGKKNHCFGKKVWKKSWILTPRICTNPEDIMAARVEPEPSVVKQKDDIFPWGLFNRERISSVGRVLDYRGEVADSIPRARPILKTEKNEGLAFALQMGIITRFWETAHLPLP